MLIFALLLSAPQSTVYGVGIRPCGVWLDARRSSDAAQAPLLTWLAGYLSAVNDYGKRGDVLQGARLQDAAYAIDETCKADPTISIKSATDAFVNRGR